MPTHDEHIDDIRRYLTSLTDTVDTAVTNRTMDARSPSSSSRWRQTAAAAAAAVVLITGALLLSGTNDHQPVSTAGDGEAAVTQGWRTVQYGDVAFDVPPGWVEQQPSSCDTRPNVQGYYLLPIRAEDPLRGQCVSPAEHWDTRDTLTLHLLPNGSTYPVPSRAATVVTDGGLEGFAWTNGDRHQEYYFPDEHLRAATYESLEPEVDPSSVVLTLRRNVPETDPEPGPLSTVDGVRVDPLRAGGCHSAVGGVRSACAATRPDSLLGG